MNLEKLYTAGVLDRIEVKGEFYYKTIAKSDVSKKQEALEVYVYFIEVFKTPARYRYKAKTLLEIGKCLKEYSKDDLIATIDNRKESLKDFNGTPSPKYHFSMSQRSDHYRLYESFLPSQSTIDELIASKILQQELQQELERLQKLYINKQNDDYKKLWQERYENNMPLPIPPEYIGNTDEFYNENNKLRELLKKQ